MSVKPHATWKLDGRKHQSSDRKSEPSKHLPNFPNHSYGKCLVKPQRTHKIEKYLRHILLKN